MYRMSTNFHLETAVILLLLTASQSGVAMARPAKSGVVMASPAVKGVAMARPAVKGVAMARPAVKGVAKARPAVKGVAIARPAVKGVGMARPAVKGVGMARPGVKGVGMARPGVKGVGMARPSVRGGQDPCSVSDFKVLCRSVVKGQKNVNAATEVSIIELMKRTIKAKEAAASGRKKGGGLGTCYSNYDNALHNLEKALKNIKKNDGFSLNINLSASLTNFDTCNEAMSGAKGSKIFAKSTNTLHEMADNCLALSTLVKQ